jgi:Tfp pilus assembly major pilin PilA
MGMVFCRGCGKEIHESAIACPHCGAPQKVAAASIPVEAIPDGVSGWSWGAFLLNWIWAIGNRVWIGLIVLIPFIGFFAAIWLGIKGRELAWKSRQWESVEHFQRVQRKWSQWALGLMLIFPIIGILAAIAIPAYSTYTQKAKISEAISILSSCKAAFEVDFAEHGSFTLNSPYQGCATTLPKGVKGVGLATGSDAVELSVVMAGDAGNAISMFGRASPDGKLSWRCFSASVPANVLGAGCEYDPAWVSNIREVQTPEEYNSPENKARLAAAAKAQADAIAQEKAQADALALAKAQAEAQQVQLQQEGQAQQPAAAQ